MGLPAPGTSGKTRRCPAPGFAAAALAPKALARLETPDTPWAGAHKTMRSLIWLI